MCYSVLEELKQVRECEQERKVIIPKPYYLFVQRYGRSPEPELPEIAKTFGNGKWFSFFAELKKKDVTMVNRFIMEMDKNAELGKAFQGYALVELTGEEDEKELFELLSYIKQSSKQLHCIFTTRMLDKADEIKKCLEQHFFVRCIEGKRYDSAEQSAIFLQVLQEHGFKTENLTEQLETLFSDVYWEEKEPVQSRIENLAQNIIYNKMLQPGAALEVALEEVEDAVKEWKKESEPIRRIGFVRGE